MASSALACDKSAVDLAVEAAKVFEPAAERRSAEARAILSAPRPAYIPIQPAPIIVPVPVPYQGPDGFYSPWR